VDHAFRVFDRVMNKFNREFERALNERPSGQRRVRNGRWFLELAESESAAGCASGSVKEFGVYSSPDS
jgi:hypothetical protein